MANVCYIHGEFRKNASVILLARVEGNDGALVTQASIASATYTVYLLDPTDPDVQTAVEDHEDVAIAPADLIFDELQTDDLWGDTDGTGYNLKHQLDVSEAQAFAAAGVEYLVRIELTPADGGQVIVVPFKGECHS